MKLAGVVTLYHPDEEVLENIKSYMGELDQLYVIDNTEVPDVNWSKKFSAIDRVRYVSFHDNKGISFALNYVLKEAKDFDFLLTMDQDSKFPEGMVKKYKESLADYEAMHPGMVGMYAVNYTGKEADAVPREISAAITSGAVLPVMIARKIGGFDEALFIDEVDSEYCYRARKRGYHIVEFSDITLHHDIGARTYHTICGFRYNTFNHAPIRRYYIVRNMIYVARKYPEIRMFYIMHIAKLIVKVLLAEKDKWNKTKHIFRGGRDAILGHMGKVEG